MEIWISHYELESTTALNSKTERRKYRGALIRAGAGFGCLHPWPELGDPTLEKCLEDLRGANETRLVRRALHCARVDGRAREEGVSLFEGMKVPDSHFLMADISEMELDDAMARGVRVVKIKAGKDAASILARVRNFGGSRPELKWRIDFNNSGCCGELARIFSTWDREELARIDFVEDPSPFHPGDWSRLPVPVGNDREMENDGGRSEVLVVKPALEKIPEGAVQRVVVTSYLDHPIGQCFAAFEAGKAGIVEICGLQSHSMFAANAFSEELGSLDPKFHCPDGGGLGFGTLLNDLNWEKL